MRAGLPRLGRPPLAGGEDVYETLSRRTGRPIVFDSTKEIRWIATQLAALRDAAAVRLVVLTRDGRAVVNSRRRKLPDGSDAGELAASGRSRCGASRRSRTTSRGPCTACATRNTSRPEQTLRALADFVGVEFDPRMLDPWSCEQHPLGGNDGPLLLLRRASARTTVAGVITPDDPTSAWYAAHPVDIVPDLRWRREPSDDDLAAFDEVAGEANRAYAWDEPA